MNLENAEFVTEAALLPNLVYIFWILHMLLIIVLIESVCIDVSVASTWACCVCYSGSHRCGSLLFGHFLRNRFLMLSVAGSAIILMGWFFSAASRMEWYTYSFCLNMRSSISVCMRMAWWETDKFKRLHSNTHAVI